MVSNKTHLCMMERLFVSLSDQRPYARQNRSRRQRLREWQVSLARLARLKPKAQWTNTRPKPIAICLMRYFLGLTGKSFMRDL